MIVLLDGNANGRAITHAGSQSSPRSLDAIEFRRPCWVNPVVFTVGGRPV